MTQTMTTQMVGTCFICGKTFIDEVTGGIFTLWNGEGKDPSGQGVCDECHSEAAANDQDGEPADIDEDSVFFNPYAGCDIYEDLVAELWADCFD